MLNTVPEFVYNTRSVSIVNQIRNQFSQFIYNKRRRMETQNLKLLISIHYLRFACYTRRLKTFTHNHTHNHTHNSFTFLSSAHHFFKQRAKGGVSSLSKSIYLPFCLLLYVPLFFSVLVLFFIRLFCRFEVPLGRILGAQISSKSVPVIL